MPRSVTPSKMRASISAPPCAAARVTIFVVLSTVIFMQPIIASLNPPSALSGGAAFALVLTGSNFGTDSVVFWGSLALATSYVSATQVSAAVPAALIQFGGGVQISLATGGFTSPPGGPIFGILNAPTLIDLCTVGQVKSWLSANGAPTLNAGDDNNIQSAITSWGAEFLRRTGNENSDGSIPPVSPFVAPVAYNETYDGTGTTEQFLRHFPCVSVQQAMINGVVIPGSTGYGALGWLIAPGGRSLILVPGGAYGANAPIVSAFYFCWDFTWTKGGQLNRMNVNIQYTAGYAATPADVTLLAIETVALTYRRRDYIDQASQSMAQGAGTTRYRDWELPPHSLKVIRGYARLAVA